MSVRSFVMMLLLALPAAPSVAVAQDDHPFLTRYAGSVLKSKQVEEFGEYKLVTGLTARQEIVGEKLSGKVTRIVYENPAGRSTLEIARNYGTALAGAGLQTIFTCALNECGPAFARSAWARYNGLFAAADGDPRYLAGKIATPQSTAYVAVMVGRSRTQLDIVEIVVMQDRLVAVDPAALAQGLDRDGRVSIYGILFDTDKADVKPESKPALDAIAQLLKDRPALNLFVVGHTDMTGGLAHNIISLSQTRALAVVKVLVETYGIAAARLDGHGVGPLAPVASNAGGTTRTRNRRVELVAR